jgi:hypothetical protein
MIISGITAVFSRRNQAQRRAVVVVVVVVVVQSGRAARDSPLFTQMPMRDQTPSRHSIHQRLTVL